MVLREEPHDVRSYETVDILSGTYLKPILPGSVEYRKTCHEVTENCLSPLADIRGGHRYELRPHNRGGESFRRLRPGGLLKIRQFRFLWLPILAAAFGGFTKAVARSLAKPPLNSLPPLPFRLLFANSLAVLRHEGLPAA